EAIAGFVDAFSAAYQSRNTPEEALADIEILREIADAETLALRFVYSEGEVLRLKFYHQAGPIPLSDRVPMLENFGFRVIDERTFTVQPAHGAEAYVHDMDLEAAPGVPPPEGDLAVRIENAILAVWRGETESDGLNQLTPRAGLSWYDVAVLRALTKYLRQIGVPFAGSYRTGVMAGRPEVASALITLFHALHDPHFAGHRDRATQGARETIAEALDATPSLDEDRIIRRYLNLVDAVLRTNA